MEYDVGGLWWSTMCWRTMVEYDVCELDRGVSPRYSTIAEIACVGEQ